MLDHSSPPSSSTDLTHGERPYLDKWPERVYVDKWPLAPSHLVDRNTDDSERGQRLLADPPAVKPADNLRNFDQTFLAEYGQQTSHKDGDNSFDFSLSSSPSCSTDFLSMHFEPIQPVALRTSRNPLSPSFISENIPTDYIPPTDLDLMSSFYDSPTGQPENSPSLDDASNATPACLHATTLVSTVFSSQNPSGQPCRCLAAIVFAVEEFEASCNSGNRAELDSILAYQKDAIKCCRSMLQCSSCMAKRENIVLLVFVTEKIVLACGRIVDCYRMEDGETRRGPVLSSMLDHFASDRPSHRVDVGNHDLATPALSPPRTDCTHSSSINSTRTSTLLGWRELLLGDYEINSPVEWEHLVRVLILLQLKGVMALLADTENLGSEILGETLTASLAQAKVRVGELEKHIHII